MWMNNPHLSSVRAATTPEPRSLRAWAVVACSCWFLVSGAPARAADLIEPWAPGLTNAELFVGFGDSSSDREVTGLVGLGIGRHLSFGLSFASLEEDDGTGMVLLYTRPLGRWGEVDLWGELQMQTTTMEAELGAAERAFGFEWSAPSRWSRGVQTYVRLSAARAEGATHLHPLLGFRIATRSRVDLHVELSGEEPDSGPWPIHLAIGPNLPVNDWLEVVPEVAVIDDRGPGGETTFAFSLGVVTDPSGWLGGFGAIGSRFTGPGGR